MRKTITFPILLLGLTLFLWINVPKNLSDSLRASTVSLFSRKSPPFPQNVEIENQRLKTQLEHVYEWAVFNRQMGAHLKEVLANELVSMPALVIYRDPSSWSSTIWVNVGEENNLALGKNIIAKNSPVVADGALVGVVDYVGKKQARIRLITDSGLSPAVRVVRGSSQNQLLIHKINELLFQIKHRTDCSELISMLAQLKEGCDLSLGDEYLAKGEVHGSSAPFWRARSPILKGIGFNYDYPDSKRSSQEPIIKEGDLLATSGLDGVFPKGLPLGTVSKVAPLKEGAYAYEIEVRPISNRLNELQTVFILPSLSE